MFRWIGWVIMLAITVLLSLAACALTLYVWGTTRSAFPDWVRTFAIPVITSLLMGLWVFRVTSRTERTMRAESRGFFETSLEMLLIAAGCLLITLGAYLGCRYFPNRIPVSAAQGFLLGACCGVVVQVIALSMLHYGGGDRGPGESRGRQLISFAAAAKSCRKIIQTGDPGIQWGGVRLPSTAADGHFCVVGVTGSGKTITLRLLMQSVLPQVRARSGNRALVYDAKQDIVSILDGMGLSSPIVVLNPFDARSFAWDMAKDVTTPAAAFQVASILIPEEQGANRFFSDAARHFITGVLCVFIRSGVHWTLRDLIWATRGRDRIRSILADAPEAQHLLTDYFQDERLASNILSTIAARLMPFEPIAALWHKSDTEGRRLSLQEWVNSESILVLGNDEANREALDAINRVIFRRLSELLLAPNTPATSRTWIILDEVAKAGRLDGLDSLLTKGRTYGVRVVLGFQDIEGLRDSSVYGEKMAHVIVGQCANKAILRLESEPTANWASGALGDMEGYELSKSHTSGSGGGGFQSTDTRSWQVQRRAAVLPSQFLTLPPPANGAFEGFYLSPLLGAYWTRIEFKPLLATTGKAPCFEPRPSNDQYLGSWQPSDFERLKIRESVPSAANAKPSTSPDEPTVLEPLTRMTLGR